MTVDDILMSMNEAGLTFPVICKPDIACGTPTSHNMVVVVSPSGFNLVTQPCIVQQYIDHDDSFYKVYIIGNDIMYYQRPSTPNLTASSSNSTAVNNSKLKSIYFDSRCMYPKLQDFMENENYNNDNSKVDNKEDNSSSNGHSHNDPSTSQSIPDAAQIIAAANALKAEFNLSLFGFDVIIPSNKIKHHNVGDTDDNNSVNELTIIDVNFFPSYKEVSDFPFRLKRLIAEKHHQREAELR